jgi:hypothetical protein
MRQCDKLDGLLDGVINNYFACRAIFDVKQGAPNRNPWAAKRCPNNVDPNPQDTSAAACLTDGQLERFYDETSSVDFSRAVLSRLPERLLVLRDANSGWMDLGSPRRVTEALAPSGIEPPWLVPNSSGAGSVRHVAAVY